MLRRVRIKSVPQARTGYQVQGALANDVPAFGGADYNAYMGKPDMKASRTLTAVPREEANLEAEGGETVVGNLDGSMMPSFKTIKGPRHTNGGVPLNLPDDSFIFSDTKDMKINDPNILKLFGKPAKKGGYTPAELSKKFDIQKYREILQNSDSDTIDRKTAELMIKNYTLKLGALALAQESKKAFPQGIPEIAKPYMEANGIAEEDLIPQEEPQQMDMSMMNQGNEAPMQMPNGQPVAMPQEMEEMSPEMMQGAPMAMYGMQMGGYALPFYDDPNEMAYGGQSQRVKKYQVGGQKNEKNLTTEDLDIIKNKWNNDKAAYINYVNSRSGILGNTKLIDSMYEQFLQDIDKQSNYTKGNKALYEGYKPELAKMTKQQMVESLLAQEERNARLAAYGLDPKTTEQNISKTNAGSRTNDKTLEFIKNNPGLADLDFKGGYKGQAAYLAYRNTLNKPEYKQFGQFQKGKSDETVGGVEGAITGIDDYNTNTTLGQRLNYQQPPEPVTPNTPKYECRCTRSDGTTYDPGTNADGSCKDCEETVPGEEMDFENPPKQPAAWWLQDTINTMGAFGDMMTNRKYMPWEARVDLEEPRPTFLDPTRELAAQSEQANIASQAAAQFAGPQALNSRLSQIQGAGAKGAADTLGRINNQNVNIANQFEANQVGVRNQENMLNQQMANRVYDKNTIANQQFDNTQKAARANMRQAYNTGLTNRAKTDALNQMYPDYQTDPSTGGMVNYRPTIKKADPGVKEQDALKFADDIMKYPEATQKLLWQQKYGKKAGGQVFQKGGFVYSVFPIVTL
jgi:hypothetical protein